MKQPSLRLLANYCKYYFGFCLLLLVSTLGFAQPTVPTTTSNPGAGKTIFIVSADRYNFQQRDTGGQFVSLGGHAIVQQERTLFYADSIVLNQKENTLEAVGNVHINDADSIHTYAEYLRYVGKEKKAYLNKNVRLTDGKGTLTTSDLMYDVQQKMGIYTNNGKVVNGKTVLTSKEGYYYGETRNVIFKKKVVLVEPDYKMYTDTLLYNLNTSTSTFLVPTKIINGKRIITTSDGFFDTKKQQGTFNKRTLVDDTSYTFAADKATIDEVSGVSEYEGNAIYKSKDTAAGYDLAAGNIKINQKQGTFLATNHPVLLIKQGLDSIYLSADTLSSGKLSQLKKTRSVPDVRSIGLSKVNTAKYKSVEVKTNKGDTTKSIFIDSLDKKIDTTIAVLPPLTKKKQQKSDSSADRYFEAYYHVKIFSDSLQAVADSIFYSSEDSIFRMFQNPVAWAQRNQIAGDTMLLYIKQKKLDRLYVYENAITIEQVGPIYFNQLKGNSINADFVKGNIQHIRAKGNAETIYYGVDEQKKFLGVNKANCDIIDMYFNPNKGDSVVPQRIVLRNNLQGTAYPMLQVNHQELRLRKFQWQIDRRPKTKFELINKQAVGG